MVTYRSAHIYISRVFLEALVGYITCRFHKANGIPRRLDQSSQLQHGFDQCLCPIMLHPLLVLLVGFILVPGRECDAGYFINPSTNTDTNPVWTLGDEQVISWRTSLDVFNISMWQESLVSVGATSIGNVYCMSVIISI